MNIYSFLNILDANLYGVFTHVSNGVNYVRDLSQLFYQSIPQFETFKRSALNFFCVETAQQEAERLQQMQSINQYASDLFEKNPYLKVPVELAVEFINVFRNIDPLSETQDPDQINHYYWLVNQIRRIVFNYFEDLPNSSITPEMGDEIFSQFHSHWIIDRINIENNGEVFEKLFNLDFLKESSFTIWNVIENPLFKSIRRIWLNIFDENYSRVQQRLIELRSQLNEIFQSEYSQITSLDFSVLMDLRKREVLREEFYGISDEDFEGFCHDYYAANMPIIEGIFHRLLDKGYYFHASFEERQRWIQSGLAENGFFPFYSNRPFTWFQIDSLKEFLMLNLCWLKYQNAIRTIMNEIKELEAY